MSLNLHNTVRGAIQAVNPDISAIWQQSLGPVILDDGSTLKLYNNVWNAKIQVQGLSSGELRHMNYLNMQGVLRKIYAYGSVDGVVRAAMKGGDLFIFKDWTPEALRDSNGRIVKDSSGQVVIDFPLRYWKVVQVTERWPSSIERGWTAGIIAEQDDSTNFVIDSSGNYLTDSYGNLVTSS